MHAGQEALQVLFHLDVYFMFEFQPEHPPQSLIGGRQRCAHSLFLFARQPRK